MLEEVHDALVLRLQQSHELVIREVRLSAVWTTASHTSTPFAFIASPSSDLYCRKGS